VRQRVPGIYVKLTCPCGASVVFAAGGLKDIEAEIPKGWFVARSGESPDPVSCPKCERSRI
jgi:hypothetical protein